MTSPWLRAFVVGAILAALFLSIGAQIVRADEPVPSAPPSPPKGGAVDAAPVPSKMTAKELEARLMERPAAAIAVGGLKWGTALAGLIFVVLRFARRFDVRRGLVAPLAPDAVPPRAFGLELSIGLALFAALGGGFIVVPIYASVYGVENLKNLPLEVLFGATAAGMIPVALAVAFGIRRGWARRREAIASDGFGGGAVVASSPWPAKSGLREGLLWFLVASLVVLTVSFATALVMNWSGVPPEPQDLVQRVIRPERAHEPWLIAIFGVLLAPLTEEYVFRGLLYPAIRDRTSRFVGALLSSALFGLVHGSWSAGPALFCLAMLLCYLYERTGSIWPGILVHVLNNATSLLPLFLLT